jgi:hypothetical protein
LDLLSDQLEQKHQEARSAEAAYEVVLPINDMVVTWTDPAAV